MNWLQYLAQKPTRFRHYLHWKRSLTRGHSSLADEFPWLVYEAVDWLRSYLKPNMRVFEWGAGGSTLFFARRVQFVVSVEHDSEWYAKVSRQLQNHDIHNVQLILCEPVKVELLPAIYSSTDERYTGLSFQRYAEVIDLFPDNYFDLVVVDGRGRSGCIKHAAAKVSSNGYLLLDNSERESYALGKQVVARWPRQEFCGPGPYSDAVWSTTVWKKCSSSEKVYWPLDEAR